MFAISPAQARRCLVLLVREKLDDVRKAKRTCCESGRQLHKIVKTKGNVELFAKSVEEFITWLWKQPLDNTLHDNCIYFEDLLLTPDKLTPRVKPSVAGELYLDAIMGRANKEHDLELLAHANRTCICG